MLDASRVGPRAELEQHAARRGRVQERDLVAARARPRRLVDEAHAGRLQRRRAPPADPRPRSRRGAGRARARQEALAALAFPRGAQSSSARRRAVAPPPCGVQEGDVGRLAGDVLARARARGRTARPELAAAASRSATAMAT